MYHLCHTRVPKVGLIVNSFYYTSDKDNKIDQQKMVYFDFVL